MTSTNLGVERARTLRRDATPAEKYLWQALRNRTVAGAKFRRHVLCGRYILDFAVKTAHLAIEIDGDSHAMGDGPARDTQRDAWLAAEGWPVLRFTNREVLGNLVGVLHAVEMALCHPHPGPLPEEG